MALGMVAMRVLTPLNRRLFGYVRPYFFPYIVLMCAAMIVVSSTEGAIVVIIKNFTNQLTVAHSLAASANAFAGPARHLYRPRRIVIRAPTISKPMSCRRSRSIFAPG